MNEDIKLGHRIYYFVNPSDHNETGAIYSTEAYSAAEASILLAQMLRVTATRLIDVTDYSRS